MADGVTIPASGTGDATPKVATDDAGSAGHVQIVKLAISTDGSATVIPADASGIRVQAVPRADSPQSERLTSANLTAGGNVDLTATVVTAGKTGRLVACDYGASVPLRVDIQTVITAGARTTKTTVFSAAGRSRKWRTPGPTYITQTAGNSFGVSITNLDTSQAADVFITLYWDEVS